MIAVGEQAPAAEPMQGAMGERPGSAPFAECGEHGIVGDAPERQQRTAVGQGFEFTGEEGTAGGNLRTDRLVLRRNASHRIDDTAAGQRESVLGVTVVTSPGQPEFQ